MLAVLVLAAVTMAFGHPDAPAGGSKPPLTEVLATGVGRDVDGARKEALRQAVSQVVGALVVASDVVANDELIDSRILTYSDGYVERWEPIGEPVPEAGMIRIRVRAWVRQGKLTKALADSNVPVRGIDLGSLAGQTETLVQQARSAEEVVTSLLRGFPAKVLSAEALAPARIAGDEAETVLELPLRVSVDGAKWKAWVDEAQRMLDPISEAKGTEAWNERTAGWYPFVAPARRIGGRDGADPPDVVSVRRSPWIDRFVPMADRASVAIAGGDSAAPAITRARKRIVAVLDAPGGRLLWWQLPEGAWRALHRHRSRPRCLVRITDGRGQEIALPVGPWRDIARSEMPGKEDTILVDGGEIGTTSLRVEQGALQPLNRLEFECLVAFPPRGSGLALGGFWKVGYPRREAAVGEDIVPDDGPITEDQAKVFVPFAIGWVDGRGLLVPTLVLPRRFRFSGGLAAANDARIEVNLVLP